MFVNSKQKNEKIVLGLLSYTYGDTLSIEEQRQLLKQYRDNDDVQILLYKKEDSDNYIGLCVIEESSINNNDTVATITLQRIAILPSFRNEGIGYDMYCELRKMYPQAQMLGSMQTSDLVGNWANRYESEFTEE